MVLFLDGFDELPQENVNRLINEIEGWCERYPSMQIVISTRPEAEIQKSIPFKVYKLAEYEFHEQKELIRKLISDEDFQENLIKNIEESSLEIKNLLKTPLMVTLFVKQYEVNLKIPKNQSEFYENLFSNIASLHDNTKAGFIRHLNSKLDVIKLQEVFEEFCFFTGNSEKLVLSRQETIGIIKKCVDNQGINVNPNDVLKDFSTVVCLLLKDGSEYSFIHRSIQEYYYSSFISNKSPIAKERFYKELIKNVEFYKKIRNVVDFLEKIDNYNYNKFFKIILIDVFIEKYKIEYNNNNLCNNVYVIFKDGHRINIIVIVEGYFEDMMIYTPKVFDLLYFSIKENMPDNIDLDVFTIGYVKDERSINIKDIKNKEVKNHIEKNFLDIGRKILKERETVIDKISRKDEIFFDF